MTGSQPPGDAIWPLPAARSVETAPHTWSRFLPAAPAPSGVSLSACAGLSPSARVCAPQPAPRPRPPWAPAPPSSWLPPTLRLVLCPRRAFLAPLRFQPRGNRDHTRVPAAGQCVARRRRGPSACSRRVRAVRDGRVGVTPRVPGESAPPSEAGTRGTRRPLLRLRVRRRFLPGGGGSAGEAGASAEGARPSSRSWTLRRAGSAFSAGAWQTFLQFYLAEKPATA